MMYLLVRWLVLAVGVMIATKIVPGISCSDTATLFVVVLILSLFNAVLKPVLLLFTLPFIILTMGLGIVVINALLFYWAGSIVQGFHVADFWSALWGGVTVSITTLIANMIIRKPAKRGPPAATPKRDDVIDI